MVNDMYRQLVGEMGNDQAAEIGVNSTFDSTSQTIKFIQESSANLITHVNDTTKKQVKDIIVDAAENGKTVKEVTAEIVDKFDSFSNYRSDLIATTETTKAYGFSTREAMRQAGFKVAVWMTTMDGRERPAHAALNNTRSEADGLFHSDGATAAFPGDFGVAALDIGCRCAIRALLPGEKAVIPNDELWADRERRRVEWEPLVNKTMNRFFEMQKSRIVSKISELRL